jgi:hypothetical protein
MHDEPNDGDDVRRNAGTHWRVVLTSGRVDASLRGFDESATRLNEPTALGPGPSAGAMIFHAGPWPMPCSSPPLTSRARGDADRKIDRLCVLCSPSWLLGRSQHEALLLVHPVGVSVGNAVMAQILAHLDNTRLCREAFYKVSEKDKH